MSPRPVDLLRRWALPAALLALAPKCALCLLGYAGLGALLGLGGPELCGATVVATAPWALWLAGLGLATGAGILLRRRRVRA
jgi:hypothetical protein